LTESTFSRRDFLARAVITAGAGLLGCSDSVDPLPDPDPDPSKSGLDHIIVVTMENRSFDHLLGWVPGADGKQSGLTYLDESGAPHVTHHLTDSQECAGADPNHSFEGGRTEYNNGACDGWLTTEGNDLYAIGYYEAADEAFLGRAALEWTVLDKYFAPILGPTFPNRLISQSGQTDRLSNTETASTLPTIWDRLIIANLRGRNYGNTLTTAGLWGARYASLIRPMSEFFRDAINGDLPEVAFIDPDFAIGAPNNSYHPPSDIRDAEAFLANIYSAITRSPNWKSTLLVITFDEWGGFFDHVRPPVAPIPDIERAAGNTDGLRGFRVPTLLISPFAPRGAVSSALYDHASILRTIEWRWSLAPLSVRDAQANSLADELNFRSPQLTAPVIEVPGGPFGRECPPAAFRESR